MSHSAAVAAYDRAMLIMERLRTVTAQLEWNRQQRDKLIGKARKVHRFTRKEIAAVTGLSERQVTRIADAYDGGEPSASYYAPDEVQQ